MNDFIARYKKNYRIVTYPNGDICCVTSIVFRTSVYDGEIQNNTEEAFEHRFFNKANIPDNINYFDMKYILDWAIKPQQVIVD